MSYFQRLEQKIRELDRDLEQQQKKLLELKELTHKAQVAKEYNRLYEEYHQLKADLIRELQGVEQERDHINDLRRNIEQDIADIKIYVSEWQEIKRDVLSYFQQLKANIQDAFSQKEEEIYKHADALMRMIDKFRQYSIRDKGHSNERELNFQNELKSYYNTRCARFKFIDVDETTEGLLGQKALSAKMKSGNILSQITKIRQQLA